MEDDTVQDLAVMNVGNNAHRKRRSSVLTNDRRIKNLLRDLTSGDISCIDFLRRASRSMQKSYNRGLGVEDDFA